MSGYIASTTQDQVNGSLTQERMREWAMAHERGTSLLSEHLPLVTIAQLQSFLVLFGRRIPAYLLAEIEQYIASRKAA